MKEILSSHKNNYVMHFKFYIFVKFYSSIDKKILHIHKEFNTSN